MYALSIYVGGARRARSLGRRARIPARRRPPSARAAPASLPCMRRRAVRRRPAMHELRRRHDPRFTKGVPRRRLLYAGLAILVLAAVALPVVGGLRDEAADERERAAEGQAQLREAERARQVRDARPVRVDGPAPAAGEEPLEHRARLLGFGEAKITEDARERVAAGTLDGDIQGTQCDVFPATDGRRAAEQDPATPVGRYDCVAFVSKLEANQQRTAVFGHPFWLVIDYKRSKLVWCKVTPRAGEGGSVLVSVPVPKPCRDPAGPG